MSAGIIGSAQVAGRTILNEVESKNLLAAAGVPVVAAQIATTRDEAVAAARAAGFPAVMKVLSDDLPHKSDVGGVRLGLADEAAVAAAYDAMMAGIRAAAPHARIDGVSIQRQAQPGVEVIIGMTTDPQFGPVLMVGLGGVLVEVLKDVAFRIVPVSARDAGEMVRELRGLPLLQGYRGAPAADLGALEAIVQSLSRFAQDNPEVREIDLNPVFAYPNGAVAVDARVVVAAKETAA